MNKYINTEQIEQYLHREEHGTPDERWRPESEFAKIIDCIPSADVVEVVRCKDCKHSIENVYSTSPNYKYFCEKTSAHSHIDYHSENWFCADGKRKENNE